MELPPDRLVPTLPLRLNYLLWVEDLLQEVNPATEKIVHGIDIGTGACCIYPILAARMKGWHFTATESVRGISARTIASKPDTSMQNYP